MIYFIIALVILILLLILIRVKKKTEIEKYFYLQMFLYFIGSAVYIGYVPVGFLFCLLIMLSHPDIKNKRFKIIAIALGFIATLISLAVNKLKL
nr:MAG: hypothetical protein DIU81_02410 [[Clostridium] cellulosi]